MPILYTKLTSNSKPGSYNYQDKYDPHAIFILLGGNDYSNIIKPSSDSFVYAYEKLMNLIVNMQIYAVGKRPKIIAVCAEDDPSMVCVNVERAVASFKYAY